MVNLNAQNLKKVLFVTTFHTIILGHFDNNLAEINKLETTHALIKFLKQLQKRRVNSISVYIYISLSVSMCPYQSL